MRLILAIMAVIILSRLDAFAGNGMKIHEVPTLGEWGMIAMFVILGIVGLIALRKRLAANSGR